ncbi:MAG: hypothetical protein IKJ81_00405 [Bacteroidales bacterium]|nr:hypothetical protein [Bacteroidales bacterium]
MSVRKESYFWTSYSDLMTSMFFVMLVLFVLTISMLHYKMVKTAKERDATAAQLAKIIQLENSIKKIDSNYFQYNEEYKRHTLKNINVSFLPRSSNINDINFSDLERLLEAGRAVVNFMKDAKRTIPDAEYMLIIEGQSSKDSYPLNDELSYSRALSLVNYWKTNGIVFDDLPCELIVSGSGCNSRFREYPDVVGNYANQRFVIHIIPKPGNFLE